MLEEEIKEIVEKIKFEKITSIDLVEILNKMSQDVKHFESENEEMKKEVKEANETITGLKNRMLSTELVEERTAELNSKTEIFEKEKIKFDAEKKYILRENKIFSETLSALIARKTISLNEWSENGGGKTETENLIKPTYKDPLDTTVQQ